MKTALIIVIISLFTLNSYGQAGRTSALIVDHKSAVKFTQIPDSVLPDIIKLKLMFRHASVGTTIDNGLNCVQGTRTNPAECKLFTPYKYDRRNWDFQGRGNSGWYGKINDFVNEVHLQIDSFDVFSFKYCYLEGLDQVAEPCGGSNFKPSLVQKAWDSLRTNFERLENKYPDKTFILWTIPLTQPGQHCTDTLNYLIRDYALKNNKILFDIADIQCHDTTNTRLVNAYGWEMAFSGYCGEKPPGPSCHPNWTGSIILAKAFWWMMGNLAGDMGPVPDTIPTVTTTPAGSITDNSALSGGNVTDDGGKSVTARGVVWSNSTKPDISLTTKTIDGSGKGTFTSQLSNLLPNTTYYLRAYATNSIGTAYGNEIEFTTDISFINEIEKNTFKILPNPSNGEFDVILPTNSRQVKIVNASGKIIFNSEVVDDYKFKIKLNEKGVYLLIILTSTQVICEKIFIITE